jgi:hypothetical protein
MTGNAKYPTVNEKENIVWNNGTCGYYWKLPDNQFSTFLRLGHSGDNVCPRLGGNKYIFLSKVTTFLNMNWNAQYISPSFLAHLWWTIAMTWRPSSSSSISKARFVTAGAISYDVWISLGNTPRAFFDFRDLTHFLASRWPSWKSDFCHLRANGCS